MKHKQFVDELVAAARDLNTAAGVEPLESNHLLTEYGCGVSRSVCALLTEILHLETWFNEPESAEDVLRSLRSRHVLPSVFRFYEQEGMLYKSLMLTYGYCLHFAGDLYNVAVGESAFYFDPVRSISCTNLVESIINSTEFTADNSLRTVLPTAVIINSFIQLLSYDGCYALGSCIANAPSMFVKFMNQRVPIAIADFKRLIYAPQRADYPEDVIMNYIGDSGILQVGIDAEFDKLYMAIEFTKGLRTFCVDLEKFGLARHGRNLIYSEDKETYLLALEYLVSVWLLSFGIVYKRRGSTLWYFDHLEPKGIPSGKDCYNSLDYALTSFSGTGV